VYRGVSGGSLPRQFWEVDDEEVRGGVDYAFMSTSLDPAVAMEYAKGGPRGSNMVFAIRMGMVDRGALPPRVPEACGLVHPF
jgi:NLR family CARD domain-containing protein 3